MTRKAGYPLGRAPGARGGAGSDVVEVSSALPPTAVHAPSLVPFCLPHHQRDGLMFRCQEILKSESRQCSFFPSPFLCPRWTYALFLSLRASTVHHPTRKGWKVSNALALRGVTDKYAPT